MMMLLLTEKQRACKNKGDKEVEVRGLGSPEEETEKATKKK